MATTFEELYKKVLLRLGSQSGEALLVAKDSVNFAQKVISRVEDFDELIVLDLTNALTVADQSTYHLVDDWGLTRPKDIYSLRYMDGDESRKLIYKPSRMLDEILPYTLTLSTEKPYWYTMRGVEVELIPVPAEAKTVYIHYSQWPLVLVEDADETSYENIDDVIIELGSDMAKLALVDKAEDAEDWTKKDWTNQAKALLSGAALESRTRPDQLRVAQPFRLRPQVHVEYWKYPFIKHNP